MRWSPPGTRGVIRLVWLCAAVVALGAMPATTVTARDPSAGRTRPPSEVGQWQLLPDDSPIMPIHAALLRTGRVWLGAGSGNDRAMFVARDFRTVVWDPTDGSFTDIETPWDLFCAGHSFLGDGRLLVAGGTRDYPTKDLDFKGARKAYTFDPREERYEVVPKMIGSRWYPSLVTLGNGRVYAIAGIDQTGQAMNVTPEVFDPIGRSWAARPDTPLWPMYPALFLTKGGRLFYSGGNVFGTQGIQPGFLHIGTSALTPVSGLTQPGERNQSASVLMPPAQRQRVMIIGGGTLPSGDSIDNVDIIDLKAPQPAYEPGPPLLHARMHVSAVLLPDRTVFVTGGGGEEEGDPVFESEIYDPISNSWQEMASASVARLYHSMALLLPDGRVLVAGSNPGAHQEHRIEIYSPPYLFQGTRPVIQQAPASIDYGSTVQISTSQASAIEWVSLIRPSAVTHSTDTEQRVVNVPSSRVAAGTLELNVPSDPSVAPPGWYMLFVTNDAGVPSVAEWVKLH